jgi:hypothetical protein
MAIGEKILAAAGIAFLTAATARGVDYDVIILDPDAACVAVCEGQQAGNITVRDADLRRHQHAAMWSDAAQGMADLNPEGCSTSQVWDAAGGLQVGVADNHAMLWSGAADSVVDLNPGNCEYSCAYGVWDRWQVGVGISRTVGEHALLWSGAADRVVDLHPAGFVVSRAGGVWGGRQVGYGVPQDGGNADWRALLWFGTGDSVVDLHPAGFRWSCACDTWGIWQVGSGVPAGGVDMRALLWSGTAESVVNLHPNGYRWSYVVRCWGNRQVGVGGDHALLWSGTAQSVIDLHRFVPDEYTYSGAFGIDSTGRIAGYVGNDSGRRAVVWVPRSAPVYQCRSIQQSTCLCTTDGAEVERLLMNPNAWTFEGILCHVPPDSLDPNAMPVYRFRARDSLARFYTIDCDERDRFFRDKRDTWTCEGIAFHAYRPSRRPASAAAVHRFRSDSLGGYLYTRDEAERARLAERSPGVWTYEGIGWYACE